MPGPITVAPIGTYDPTKDDPSLWPVTDQAQLDASEGVVHTRQAISDLVGGLPNGGRAVLTEIRRYAYGKDEDAGLIAQMLTNDQGGDGRYTLTIVDSNCTTNDDCQRRATQELSLRKATKGQITFATFADEAVIGALVRYIDTVDGVDVTWPIQAINYAIVGSQLEKQCTASPSVPKSVGQIASESYRTSKRGNSTRRVDNKTAP